MARSRYSFSGWLDKTPLNPTIDTIRTKIVPQDSDFRNITVLAQWTPKPAPYYPPAPEPTPEPITYTVNFDPNNSIEDNKPETVSTTESQITLPECEYQSQPGQLFMGWQEVDTEYDQKDEEGNIIYPRYGKGDIYQPGDKFGVKNTTLIAVWADNPTFRMDCADEYELMPPENTMEALEKLIRQNLKITYYKDGLDPDDPTVVPVVPTPTATPTPVPTPIPTPVPTLEPTLLNATSMRTVDDEDPEPTPIPEHQLWDDGSHMPKDDLEITVSDPKLFRNMGSFEAKVTYKGLYARTLDKTIKVTVLDPNAPINDSFIMHIENFGDVTVTYPTSISYHGDEWDKVKTLVKLTCDKTKISAKKVTSTDITKAKAGDTVTIKKIKTKVFTNKNGINQKEAKKLTKKVNKKLKSHLPKTFVIRPLIVMPEYDPQIDRLEGRMPSVISLRVPDIGLVNIKSDSFTVDKENKIVTFTGNYDGYVTFDELGKSERIR